MSVYIANHEPEREKCVWYTVYIVEGGAVSDPIVTNSVSVAILPTKMIA
jgi:hypothetical protein